MSVHSFTCQRAGTKYSQLKHRHTKKRKSYSAEFWWRKDVVRIYRERLFHEKPVSAWRMLTSEV